MNNEMNFNHNRGLIRVRCGITLPGFVIPFHLPALYGRPQPINTGGFPIDQLSAGGFGHRTDVKKHRPEVFGHVKTATS